MSLKFLIGLCQEVENVLEAYRQEFQVVLFEGEEELRDVLSEDTKSECLGNRSFLKSEALLIAATDKTIAFGKRYGVAAIAYANPKIPEQTYSGVEMLVEGFEEVNGDFLEKQYQRFHHLPWTIAETKRCVIREFAMEDLDALFELYANGEMSRYTEDLFPYEEEKEYQQAYINNMYRYYGYGMWLVILKENGKVIGRAGLEHREYLEEVELELGYLIHKDYQGKGYATEVCQGILEYARENSGFTRINTLIEEGNIASIRLAEKLGFAYVADFDLNGKRAHRFVRELM